LDKLPNAFRNFKGNESHYVCKIRKHGGRLRDGLWLGLADGRIYANPREGIQIQFGISGKMADVYGIWIEGTYPARPARLKAAGRLVASGDDFIKLLRRLGSRFWVRYKTSEDYDWHHIRATELTLADLDKLAHALPRAGTYVEIGPSLSNMGYSLQRKDVLALGRHTTDHIVKTFTKLLPLYQFLAEAKEPLPKRKSGRILSTEIIHESASWGMEIALKFETKQGREAKNVSRTTEGYDILSREKSGKTRCIEVKARRGGFRVALTDHEHEVAKREKNRYYLYVIRGDGSIHMIRNPANKCLTREVMVTEHEMVDWIKKGTVHRLKKS